MATAKTKPSKVVGGQVEKVGPIRVVSGVRSAEPQLTDERGKHYLLSGEWRRELLRLGGHRVKVWGQLGEKKLMHPTIKVKRYEIVDSGGGHKPHVGVLVKGASDTLQLRTDEVVLEVVAKGGLDKLLRKRVGCKVWIVGEVAAGSLKASKFGWLACNKNKSIKPKKETPR
jgi:hypothetical protein